MKARDSWRNKRSGRNNSYYMKAFRQLPAIDTGDDSFTTSFVTFLSLNGS